MHELSISSAVVETALAHAGGRRVSTVNVRVGRLRQVVPESLAFYFGIVSRDTDCEDASLELELIDALMGCDCCGQEWDPAPPAEPAIHSGLESMSLLPQFRCPACEGVGARVLRGEELEVESIEVEDGDPEPDRSPSGRAATPG
jgi:hydrogenase nickel incorporation protein HypA/HybF